MGNKSVAILSMQRVVNYGSFLQAYALKQLLLRNGAADVHFIDIEPGRQLKGYETTGFPNAWRNFKRRTTTVLSGHTCRKIRDNRFYTTLCRKFREEYYGMLSLDAPAPERFDLAVIGSDEVFNCCQRTEYGFTTQLYGAIPEADRVISYAASFGHTTLSDLHKYRLTEEVINALSNLSAISVRDENSADIIRSLTGTRPAIHLDPVLVYDFSAEISQAVKPHLNNYILLYSYQERFRDKSEIAKITRLAKDEGKILVSLFARYDWCDHSVIPDTPFDVLAWFRDAEFVITDTFHGTIFSIINRKRFVSFVRESNREKLIHLLDEMNLTDCAFRPEQSRIVIPENIDYTRTDRIIAAKRKEAVEYLQRNLTGN